MKHNRKTIAEFVDKGDWDGLVIEIGLFFEELRELQKDHIDKWWEPSYKACANRIINEILGEQP